jgi:putative SOS response-associated peptidase YedK
MCGRFTFTNPTDELAGYFNVLVKTQLSPRYNIAPTQPVSCVRRTAPSATGPSDPKGAPVRELVDLRWGLIPYWAKDPAIGNRMINARSESVAEKPAYKEAFGKRRCLIVADGFYEWKRLKGGKQPYFIFMADRRPFAFAGLWECWKPQENHLKKITGPGRPKIPMSADDRVESCSILTTSPNELVGAIHDRMPVIVPAEYWDTWLDPESNGPEVLGKLLIPYPTEKMRAHPVSTYVNKPVNDDPTCIEPLKRLKIKRPRSNSRYP